MCDNMAVVQVITALTSKDPVLMHLLRLLYFFLAVHDVHFWAEHIPGVHNTVADAVSRNLMQVFHQARPTAREEPDPVSDSLKDLLATDNQVSLSPDWRESLKNSWRPV